MCRPADLQFWPRGRKQFFRVIYPVMKWVLDSYAGSSNFTAVTQESGARVLAVVVM
jgi:hypothetical protein